MASGRAQIEPDQQTERGHGEGEQGKERKGVGEAEDQEAMSIPGEQEAKGVHGPRGCIANMAELHRGRGLG